MPAAIRVGVEDVMGWVVAAGATLSGGGRCRACVEGGPDVNPTGVATTRGWARTDGGCADAKAMFAVIHITDRRSPARMRKRRLTVMEKFTLEFGVLDKFLVQDLFEPRLNVDKLQIHGDGVVVGFCHF